MVEIWETNPTLIKPSMELSHLHALFRYVHFYFTRLLVSLYNLITFRSTTLQLDLCCFSKRKISQVCICRPECWGGGPSRKYSRDPLHVVFPSNGSIRATLCANAHRSASIKKLYTSDCLSQGLVYQPGPSWCHQSWWLLETSTTIIGFPSALCKTRPCIFYLTLLRWHGSDMNQLTWRSWPDLSVLIKLWHLL